MSQEADRLYSQMIELIEAAYPGGVFDPAKLYRLGQQIQKVTGERGADLIREAQREVQARRKREGGSGGGTCKPGQTQATTGCQPGKALTPSIKALRAKYKTNRRPQ